MCRICPRLCVYLVKNSRGREEGMTKSDALPFPYLQGGLPAHRLGYVDIGSVSG